MEVYVGGEPISDVIFRWNFRNRSTFVPVHREGWLEQNLVFLHGQEILLVRERKATRVAQLQFNLADFVDGIFMGEFEPQKLKESTNTPKSVTSYGREEDEATLYQKMLENYISTHRGRIVIAHSEIVDDVRKDIQKIVGDENLRPIYCEYLTFY